MNGEGGCSSIPWDLISCPYPPTWGPSQYIWSQGSHCSLGPTQCRTVFSPAWVVLRTQETSVWLATPRGDYLKVLVVPVAVWWCLVVPGTQCHVGMCNVQWCPVIPSAWWCPVPGRDVRWPVVSAGAQWLSSSAWYPAEISSAQWCPLPVGGHQNLVPTGT